MTGRAFSAYPDMPMSVLVGSDPNTAPRYYYVFDGHGNVVALTDAQGNAVATYAYDEFGNVTIDTEHFTSGWRCQCSASPCSHV